MDLHHLKIFAAVYQHLSFTKASEKLHISQPTISEHIKNLEKEFSYRLFDRLGRSIAPTPKAEEIYPKVISLLDTVERLKDEFIAAEGRVCGELIIGASTIPGAYVLPVRVSNFARKYPDVYFEIRIGDTKEMVEKVLDHSLFCAIVGSKKKCEGLQYTPLFADELVFVVGKAHTSKVSEPMLPGDLCRYSLLVRERGSGTRDSMVRLLAEAGINFNDLKITATFGSSAAIKEAVTAGLGISCLSRLAVQGAISRGDLLEVSVAGLSMKRKFYLVHHKRRTMPDRYQKFCDFLLENEDYDILNIDSLRLK